MGVSETEIKKELKELGVLLLQCRSPSLHDLLSLFHRLECLLIKVEQAPSRCIRDALLPVMKALISSALLRHSNADVRVSLAFCYSEITRITAPDAPYSDEPMKEMFQLIVEAFKHLSDLSSPSYKKAVSILKTSAMVRSCLVMLDLGLDQLILKMFQQFLTIVRSNHSPDILLAMETIMTLVIDESEEISLAILTPLLASIRKDNQSISPCAWKLGEKVMTNCAAKLQPRLKDAVQSVGIALDDYASIVADICRDRSHTIQHNHLIKCSVIDGMAQNGYHNDCSNSISTNGAASTWSSSTAKHGGSVQQWQSNSEQVNNGEANINLENGQTCLPRKRRRKPASLMKPEEGYYHQAKIQTERKAVVVGERKPRGRPRKNVTTVSTPGMNQAKKHTPKVKATEGLDGLDERLIGKRIKVWWPQDRMFYEGVVDSYDPSRQRYKVFYTDGDEENLNLRKERWELLESDKNTIDDPVKEAPPSLVTSGGSSSSGKQQEAAKV